MQKEVVSEFLKSSADLLPFNFCHLPFAFNVESRSSQWTGAAFYIEDGGHNRI